MSELVEPLKGRELNYDQRTESAAKWHSRYERLPAEIQERITESAPELAPAGHTGSVLGYAVVAAEAALELDGSTKSLDSAQRLLAETARALHESGGGSEARHLLDRHDWTYEKSLRFLSSESIAADERYDKYFRRDVRRDTSADIDEAEHIVKVVSSRLLGSGQPRSELLDAVVASLADDFGMEIVSIAFDSWFLIRLNHSENLMWYAVTCEQILDGLCDAWLHCDWRLR